MDLPISAVKLVQTALKQLNLYQGAIDGQAGPQTAAATTRALIARSGELVPSTRLARTGINTWSDQRKITAYYQLMAKDAGHAVGPIDGIWGQLTGKAHLALTEKLSTDFNEAARPMDRPVAPAFSFAFTPDLFNAEIRKVIDLNEGARGDKIYQISHAGTGKSGFSLGRTQTDLAARAQSRRELVALVARTVRLDDRSAAALDAALKAKGNPKGLTKDQSTHLATVLSTTDGRALVDKWDNSNFQEMMDMSRRFGESAARNPLFSTSQNFNDYARHIEPAVVIADNGNQFGAAQNTLNNWVSGQDVRQSGVLVPRPTAAFRFAEIASLERQYKYVLDTDQGAGDIRRRRGNIMNVLLGDNLIDSARHAENTTAIRTLYTPLARRAMS